MQISDVFTQVEISFWQFVVRLMNNRRLIYCIIAGISFGLCIMVVLTARSSLRTLYKTSSDYSASSPKVVIPNSRSEADKKNNSSQILIVIVDQLRTSYVDLHGIWLGTFQPNIAKLVLKPVDINDFSGFPILSENQAEFARRNQVMGVTSDFLEYLKSKSINWDYTIFLDETAMFDMMELSGGSILAGENVYFSLVRQLCYANDSFTKLADPIYLVERLSKHIWADFETGLIVKFLYNIKTTDSILSCEFQISAEASNVPNR